MEFAFDVREKFNYDTMGDITKMAYIISNGDMKVVDYFKLLEEDFQKFRATYPDWYEEYDSELEDEAVFKLKTFVYWLTWYVDNYKYGAYFPWGEDTESLILQLENSNKHWKYDINFSEFEFDEDVNEEQRVMLQRLSKFVATRNYGLIHVDTRSECYHIFILRLSDIDEILKLGKNVGFDIIKL